jgi:hypothetical protein
VLLARAAEAEAGGELDPEGDHELLATEEADVAAFVALVAAGLRRASLRLR